MIVYSTVYSGSDQRKHQSSASLAFVWGIHRWPVNSPHKWPVTRKMFPFDDVIMHLTADAIEAKLCPTSPWNLLRRGQIIGHHDGVIKWKHFPRNWPFVRGIHRSRWIPHTHRSVTRSFDVFFDVCLNKRLSKQPWGWWFETPSWSLWRQCNDITVLVERRVLSVTTLLGFNGSQTIYVKYCCEENVSCLHIAVQLFIYVSEPNQIFIYIIANNIWMHLHLSSFVFSQFCLGGFTDIEKSPHWVLVVV